MYDEMIIWQLWDENYECYNLLEAFNIFLVFFSLHFWLHLSDFHKIFLFLIKKHCLNILDITLICNAISKLKTKCYKNKLFRKIPDNNSNYPKSYQLNEYRNEPLKKVENVLLNKCYPVKLKKRIHNIYNNFNDKKQIIPHMFASPYTNELSQKFQ